MVKLLDKLKDDLNILVDQPELIHDESFMMGMMHPWAEELPPFQEYSTCTKNWNNIRITISIKH